MRHFKIDEFKCPCCGRVEMEQDFLDMIDSARGFAQIPLIVNSGFRCPDNNIAVGSTSTNHTRGKAVDIRCFSDQTRLKVVRALFKAGFRRLGIGQTYIHADTNNLSPAIWVY